MKKDLTGQKFNNVTVLSCTEKRSGGSIIWACQCVCGFKFCVKTSDLKSGNTKSCGCMGSGNRIKDSDTVNINYLFGRYVISARKRHIKFHLTKENCLNLFKSKCHYCSIDPAQISNVSATKKPFKYNGIDRKNSSKPYILNNCVPCCLICSRAKNTLSYEEFINWVKQVKYN